MRIDDWQRESKTGEKTEKKEEKEFILISVKHFWVGKFLIDLLTFIYILPFYLWGNSQDYIIHISKMGWTGEEGVGEVSCFFLALGTLSGFRHPGSNCKSIVLFKQPLVRQGRHPNKAVHKQTSRSGSNSINRIWRWNSWKLKSSFRLLVWGVLWLFILIGLIHITYFLFYSYNIVSTTFSSRRFLICK